MSRREKREQEELEEKQRKKQEKEEKKKNKKNKKEKENKKEQENKKDKKNKKSSKKEKSSVGKILLKAFLIIILVIILILGCYIGWLGSTCDWQLDKMFKTSAKQVALAITGQTEEDIQNLDPIYCLVLGVSTDEGLTLTDTIIVCAYYPRTQQASMLSIPRDTFVGRSESTANSTNKINAQYQNDGNVSDMLDAVNNLTGLNIENYVIVKNEGLIQFVDAIGGVEFDVPMDMEYDDAKQNLHIYLSKGRQRLNGEQAEGLLRFRHNNDGTSYPTEYGDNDIGRMRTQREFITETIKQTLKVSNITKINDLIKIAFDNIETNLDMDYVLKYSPAIIDFDASAIQTAYVPGVSEQFGPYNLYFYKANKTETQKIVQELFTFKQQEYDSGTAETVSLKPSNIKLQVLNATGDDEILEATVEKLEDKGYNIQETGITTVAKTTKVINRTEKKDDVIDELINTLGYGDISTGQDKANYDFTIVLGQDMKQLALQN